MDSIATIDAAGRRGRAVRAVAAAVTGNMLEFYDFIIYASFAGPISRAFFPSGSELTSLLLSFVTFGLGFVARPFGAAVLGAYADRRGRRKALSLTILLMALGTGMIALCPGFASIGIAAPLIVVAARLVQGFSAGGEIGSALSVLVEHAPAERRGFYASFQQMAQGGALMLSALVSLAIALSLSADQVGEWGWRLAFLFGLLIAPVGFYIRRSLPEAPVFEAARAEAPAHGSAREVFAGHWRAILVGMLLVLLWTVAQYLTSFMPTFASRELKMSLPNAYLGPLVTSVFLVASPLVGRLADRFNRKAVMAVGALGLLVAPWFAFSRLAGHRDLASLLLAQSAVGLFMLIYTAPASAVLAELYPTRIRATGIAITYSLSVAIFGGFTPANLTLLIGWTGDPVSVAWYLMAAAAVSLITVLSITDRTGQTLA